MINFGPAEKVHVELVWYDGPRSGIADIQGIPHRFSSNFDETDDEYLGTFVIFPISLEILGLEQEQWRIFTLWNTRYEAGQESTITHPGHGGISARWDEIEVLLRASRSEIPHDAKNALAELIQLQQGQRYSESGPDYALRWSIL